MVELPGNRLLAKNSGSNVRNSLSHGTNDAQETIGIIVGLLMASQAQFVDFPIQAFCITSAETIPVWVR